MQRQHANSSLKMQSHNMICALMVLTNAPKNSPADPLIFRRYSVSCGLYNICVLFDCFSVAALVFHLCALQTESTECHICVSERFTLATCLSCLHYVLLFCSASRHGKDASIRFVLRLLCSCLVSDLASAFPS